jgi:RnfABCDGE-type electron transport complex B subunit
MLNALILMGGLGLLASAGLAIASRILRVDQDPRIDEVLDRLPGANCGGCGFAGCAALAEAIVAGKAEANACVAGGDDVAVAVAAVMGVDVSFNEPRLARGYCGDSSRASDKFDYDGALDCRAAALIQGGPVSCELGCLGYGSCAKACQFDAIEMSDEGKPIFYAANCKGCGACVEVCPRNIISLRKMSEHLIHLNLQTECLAPCTQLCPAQINIKGYIEAAGEGRYEEALAEYRKILRHYPDVAEAYEQAIWIEAVVNGSPQRAAKLLRRARRRRVEVGETFARLCVAVRMPA